MWPFCSTLKHRIEIQEGLIRERDARIASYFQKVQSLESLKVQSLESQLAHARADVEKVKREQTEADLLYVSLQIVVKLLQGTNKDQLADLARQQLEYLNRQPLGGLEGLAFPPLLPDFVVPQPKDE